MTTKKLTKAPAGWKKTIGASTAPRGYEWYSNGESRFSGKRKIALVKRKRGVWRKIQRKRF